MTAVCSNVSAFHYYFQSFHVSIGTGKEWRVVCYGSYSDIHVLDALSLEVIEFKLIS